MRVMITVGLTALALSSCDRIEGAHQGTRVEDTRSRLKQARRECASRLTFDRLKEYVFDEAARIRNSDPRRLDQIAAFSVARMDEPVVKSRDDRLNITVCTGQFVLNLPPGVQDAFDNQTLIKADVEYAAQAAADGSGLVYSMTGAEPIIYRLATLGLTSRQMPQVVAGPAPAKAEQEPAPEVVLVETQAGPLRTPATTSPKETTSAARELRPRQERETSGEAKASASPSFKCKYAKTRSEKLVCSSSGLAAADRRMSAVYYSEMAGSSGETKRELRRTRDKFLARRERCASEACVARVYAERVAEIRRIALAPRTESGKASRSAS